MGFRIVGEELCQCPCHDSCPCARNVTAAIGQWWDSCTCPGSGRMREEGRHRWNRGRPPELEEIRRSEHAETEAWDEVEAAVLARSAERSRAEVRQMSSRDCSPRTAQYPMTAFLTCGLSRSHLPLSLFRRMPERRRC
jgi:hypothetical protein